MLSAFVTGLAGTELAPREAAVLRAAAPCGIILFARNVSDPEQVRRLTSAARDAVGDDILVLIDQEGGRVRRLTPPHWRELPPASAYGALYAQDVDRACRSARLAARLLAQDLRAVGINTNCAPVLDLPVPGSHDIIGNRAYGAGVEQVVALARAVAEGHMAGGVLPVIKHMPGHGRATEDSHLALPVVRTSLRELERTDFAPFRALAHMPVAMTAHVVFAAVDPEHPASTSARVTQDIMRTSIGFDGLLVSDDLGMQALTGSISQRATAVLAAGSDIALVCSGDIADTEAVAAAVPRLDGLSQARFARARAVLRQQAAFDVAEAEAHLQRALHALA
jgi:beta-N-acetylhexosaminidase